MRKKYIFWTNYFTFLWHKPNVDFVVVENKNKFGNSGSDGIDLYDNFKIINKRIQGWFFYFTLELFYSIHCYLATRVVLERPFETLIFKFKI